MRIQVIGNCQARPLADLVERATGFAAEPPIILHLAKPEDVEPQTQAIAQADLVFAQRTDPAFAMEHLRSTHLKATRPDTVTVWPNVFYGGEHPFLRYVTRAGSGRVFGPLTEYHDLRHLRAWFADRQGVDFMPEIETPDFVRIYAAQSFEALHGREAECDVTIADVIEAETRSLFWTFNHPNLWLLTCLCNRILDCAGLPHPNTDGMREPLNRIQPPFGFDAPAEPGEPYQGVEVNLSTPGKVALGPVRRYSAAALRDVAFACYDHQADMLDPALLRITPQ